LKGISQKSLLSNAVLRLDEYLQQSPTRKEVTIQSYKLSGYTVKQTGEYFQWLAAQ
jgi:hypothetical protein